LFSLSYAMQVNTASNIDARNSIFRLNLLKAKGKRIRGRFFGNRDNVARTGLLASSEASQFEVCYSCASM